MLQKKIKQFIAKQSSYSWVYIAPAGCELNEIIHA